MPDGRHYPVDRALLRATLRYLSAEWSTSQQATGRAIVNHLVRAGWIERDALAYLRMAKSAQKDALRHG